MWSAIVNIFLGLWVMLAPGLLDFNKTAANNNYIIGPLVITFAITAIWEVNRSARYVNIPVGAWLAISPFLLAFDSTAATWSNVLSGALILIFSLFRGKITGKYGGGWRSLIQRESRTGTGNHQESGGTVFSSSDDMKEKNQTGIIPDQETGKAIDAVSEIELRSEEEARRFFAVVKERVRQVNNWHELAGELSAEFQLVDDAGKEVSRGVEKGDYFKIDIPGPGPESGDGYDWVQVEEVEEVSETGMESFALRVKPAQNPTGNKDDISHFYSPDSTSSFTVTRENNKITAGIYDRNTKPNKEAESVPDKIRDAVVGAVGVLSFSKIQWKLLTDALLEKED